jgi:hypothetical protein
VSSCTPDYDDVEPALYDVQINQETRVSIESPVSGYKFSESRYYTTLFSGTNITQSEKDKMVSTYPEGIKITYATLKDGRLEVTEKTVTHEISRK